VGWNTLLKLKLWHDLVNLKRFYYCKTNRETKVQLAEKD